MNLNDQTNVWLPEIGQLVCVRDLGPEIKLFGIRLPQKEGKPCQHYQPGQFAFLSAFGAGEAPFGIASYSEDVGVIEFVVQRLGGVTTALHELGLGDQVGVRGPLGNCFPMEQFQGKNIVIVGGGIGAAPLRPVIQCIFAHRADFGEVSIFMAARTPDLLVFQDEYEEWAQMPRTKVYVTVDEGREGWTGEVGLVTDLVKKVYPSAQNAVSITCGPPIMIYYADQLLETLGFAEENRYVTLEARMHCGIGKCGRCNLGDKLVCVDGPVFSMREVDALLESYL